MIRKFTSRAPPQTARGMTKPHIRDYAEEAKAIMNQLNDCVPRADQVMRDLHDAWINWEPK